METDEYSLDDDSLHEILVRMRYDELVKIIFLGTQTFRVVSFLFFWKEKAKYDLRLPDFENIWSIPGTTCSNIELNRGGKSSYVIGRRRYVELATLWGSKCYEGSELYEDPAILLRRSIKDRNYKLVSRFSALTYDTESALIELCRTIKPISTTDTFSEFYPITGNLSENENSLIYIDPKEWKLLYFLVYMSKIQFNDIRWRIVVMESALYRDNLELLIWALDHRSPQISLNKIVSSFPLAILYELILDLPANTCFHLFKVAIENDAILCLRFLLRNFRHVLNPDLLELLVLKNNPILLREFHPNYIEPAENNITEKMITLYTFSTEEQFTEQFTGEQFNENCNDMKLAFSCACNDKLTERSDFKIRHLLNIGYKPDYDDLLNFNNNNRLHNVELFFRILLNVSDSKPNLIKLIQNAVLSENYLTAEILRKMISDDALIDEALISLKFKTDTHFLYRWNECFSPYLFKSDNEEIGNEESGNPLYRYRNKHVFQLILSDQSPQVSGSIRIKDELINRMKQENNKTGLVVLLKLIVNHTDLLILLWNNPEVWGWLGYRIFLTAFWCIWVNIIDVINILQIKIDTLRTKTYPVRDGANIIGEMDRDVVRIRISESIINEYKNRSYIYEDSHKKMRPDDVHHGIPDFSL